MKQNIQKGSKVVSTEEKKSEEKLKDQAEITKYPELRDLKNKYGEIYIFTSGTGEICYLRSPDLETVGRAIAQVNHQNTSENNEAKAGEVIVRSCWVGGSRKFLEEDSVELTSASMRAFQLIELTTIDIEKK